MVRIWKRERGDTPKEAAEPRSPFTGAPAPTPWKVIERYALDAPFAYAVIAEDPSIKAKKYFLDEIALSRKEVSTYAELLQRLESELTVRRSETDPRAYFAEQARRIVKKYSITAPRLSWPKILYFAERDLVGTGVLDPLMRDPNVEDISADGVEKPVFVYHRRYENLETNVVFGNDKDLDDLISRLTHLAKKHVSTAFPIVQGTLPGRHRLTATFRREVSPYGGTLTIRKFREDPLTVIDMLNYGVVSHDLAAYIWLLMENRATAIVAGATGSGKTTLLNALLTLTRTSSKVVTIEEVQEINIAHSNWAALVARQSYGTIEESGGEVGLFDLVKTSLRMRPDILVVGEVRGEEAYVLFQAIATGHGGLCTLHADDVNSAIQRLTSKPMDVPHSFIPFLDLVFTVRRISIPIPGGGFRNVRRVVSVDEVRSVGNYANMFRWDPTTDKHVVSQLMNSSKLARLAGELGRSLPDVIAEISRRALYLRWAQEKGIRNFKELAPLFEEYLTSPDEAYAKASEELEVRGVTLEAPSLGAMQ